MDNPITLLDSEKKGVRAKILVAQRAFLVPHAETGFSVLYFVEYCPPGGAILVINLGKSKYLWIHKLNFFQLQCVR